MIGKIRYRTTSEISNSIIEYNNTMHNINFRTLVFTAKGRNLVCSFFKTFAFVVFSLYKVILKNDRKEGFEISKHFFDEL